MVFLYEFYQLAKRQLFITLSEIDEIYIDLQSFRSFGQVIIGFALIPFFYSNINENLIFLIVWYTLLVLLMTSFDIIALTSRFEKIFFCIA